MRLPYLLCWSLVLLLSPALRAAPAADAVLQQGLHQAETQTDSLQAALQIWYADRPKAAADLLTKYFPLTKDLGAVIGTEVVATQHFTARFDRYFLAIYFERRPLWILIDRYQGKDQGVYLPLKASLTADDILPAFLADLVR